MEMIASYHTLGIEDGALLLELCRVRIPGIGWIRVDLQL